ncbi:hypothetical protein E2C01_012144 [Portunus trituberculatus]|uniref:Uncharacterized protein n=1 Tax=Portunus trituberculatus TaxID=210409 RepID=A0A5B7DD89_PORTR|nr:hypothetical protein [Portunus trituberculatus]
MVCGSHLKEEPRDNTLVFCRGTFFTWEHRKKPWCSTHFFQKISKPRKFLSKVLFVEKHVYCKKFTPLLLHSATLPVG